MEDFERRKETGHVRVAALTGYKLEARQRERDGPALQQVDAMSVSEEDGGWTVRTLDHDEIDEKARRSVCRWCRRQGSTFTAT